MYGYKENVKIINDGAENIKKYLKEYNIKQVDYVVSGLPFTVLPVSITNAILKNNEFATCN